MQRTEKSKKLNVNSVGFASDLGDDTTTAGGNSSGQEQRTGLRVRNKSPEQKRAESRERRRELRAFEKLVKSPSPQRKKSGSTPSASKPQSRPGSPGKDKKTKSVAAGLLPLAASAAGASVGDVALGNMDEDIKSDIMQPGDYLLEKMVGVGGAGGEIKSQNNSKDSGPNGVPSFSLTSMELSDSEHHSPSTYSIDDVGSSAEDSKLLKGAEETHSEDGGYDMEDRGTYESETLFRPGQVKEA